MLIAKISKICNSNVLVGESLRVDPDSDSGGLAEFMETVIVKMPRSYNMEYKSLSQRFLQSVFSGSGRLNKLG